jgi:prolyl-tRNA editing enzyme YbaK/EbsC (Cys-tRNA(Pro) deacylase)
VQERDVEQILSKSARRVQEALDRLGLPCRVVQLSQSSRSADEAALAVGCKVGQIVKSLVFRGERSGQALLALVSGANRADEALLRREFGEAVGKADATFVRKQTGFAIGGVAPLGHPHPLATLIDEDLLAQGQLWAAAGTPHALFSLTPEQLLAMTGGRPVRLRVDDAL